MPTEQNNTEPFETTSDGQPLARMHPFRTVVRDAAIVVLGASCCGFLVNLFRPTGGIPFVQRKPYDIVVPCAEPVGDAKALSPEDPLVRDGSSLVIDARSSSDFEAFHLPHALNIPFDWLGPPLAKETNEVAERVARSRTRAVIVYGDGDDPDSGAEWARLLAGSGLKNVYFVKGGAAALRANPPEASPRTPLPLSASGGQP